MYPSACSNLNCVYATVIKCSWDSYGTQKTNLRNKIIIISCSFWPVKLRLLLILFYCLKPDDFALQGETYD
jgi:hypothetical protein